MDSGDTTGRGLHEVAVTAWFQRVPGRSAKALIRAFDGAFAALWQRSHVTLGEVTLIAIVERVLHTATEQFPMLASLEVDASGLRCDKLRSQRGTSVEQSAAAIRFVLVEFLTVLGNLTAEILTPALHAELARAPTSQDQAR